MKLFLIAFISLFLISCSSQPPAQSNERIVEKNKQTALRNELTLIVRDAQKVEKDGRDLDYYRNSYFPNDKKECETSSAKKREGFDEFKAQVGKLPDPYREKLSALYEDLDKCLNCDKKAVESCKKARAAINQVIKEIFPE